VFEKSGVFSLKKKSELLDFGIIMWIGK